MPLHVTQRDINQGGIFPDAEDRYHFRQLLRRAFRNRGIALHAFVLLDNHFRLLLTPGAVGTLSRAMGWVGQSYVQACNLGHTAAVRSGKGESRLAWCRPGATC